MFLKSSVSLKQEIKYNRIIDFIRILYTVYTTINDIGKEKILIVQTPITYENCYNHNYIENIIFDIESARGYKKFDKVISSLKHIKRGNHLLTLIEAK